MNLLGFRVEGLGDVRRSLLGFRGLGMSGCREALPVPSPQLCESFPGGCAGGALRPKRGFRGLGGLGFRGLGVRG